MFIHPTLSSATMNSSYYHTQCWASGSSTHSGFADVHLHLDESSHLIDEMIKGSQYAAVEEAPHNGGGNPGKAKVLFQFFDGWPMPQS